MSLQSRESCSLQNIEKTRNRLLWPEKGSRLLHLIWYAHYLLLLYTLHFKNILTPISGLNSNNHILQNPPRRKRTRLGAPLPIYHLQTTYHPHIRLHNRHIYQPRSFHRLSWLSISFRPSLQAQDWSYITYFGNSDNNLCSVRE